MYIGTFGIFLGISPGTRTYQYSIIMRVNRRAKAPRAQPIVGKNSIILSKVRELSFPDFKSFNERTALFLCGLEDYVFFVPLPARQIADELGKE